MIFKSLFSVFTALAVFASSFAPPVMTAVSAESTDDNSFRIDNYTQHTIHFPEPFSKISTRSESEKNIEAAISYVKSLDLSKSGHSYIEEACLSELNAYKDDGVVLESYTVLVPKTKTKYYYGTYCGCDFYYEYTSVSNMRRETNGTSKDASNAPLWTYWVLGALDLTMCFAKYKVSIPYTLIRLITGITSPTQIYYGSHNRYVQQFYSTVTRSIYKKRGSNYVRGYQDQSSSLRIKLYFCPVGPDASSDFYEISDVFNGFVTANDFTKEQILRAAHVYSNHNGCIVYTVSANRIIEEWEASNSPHIFTANQPQHLFTRRIDL
ncbi:MAG: hypothetical protein IKZ82_01070 [Clostridia bacterium]|nr:hypothetical protein [Clostridia bacterium]